MSEDKNQEHLLAYSLITPTLLIMAVVIVFPFLYALWLSLHRVNFLFPDQPFVGLDNYVQMLSNKDFWASVGRTVYFTIVSIFLQAVLGLAVAQFLNQDFRGRTILRALILIPWAIPTVVNGTLWKWILDGSTGVLNHLLMQLGIIDRNIIWLGQPFLAINMVILADTWRMLPLYIILFLGGLQGIPDDLYDAAKVDGASNWARFWFITLPFLRPIILVILILRTIQTFRVFDIIYIMTRGGPANGTMVVTFLAYFTTFKFQNFGYGSAMAFFIGITTIALAIIYIRALRGVE
jgi:multiple sugar transport system permease protein/N,N'-diacetylchitobiose transport system permease protein